MNVVDRLEVLETDLTLLSGFILKLFGANYEDYCRQYGQGGGGGVKDNPVVTGGPAPVSFGNRVLINPFLDEGDNPDPDQAEGEEKVNNGCTSEGLATPIVISGGVSFPSVLKSLVEVAETGKVGEEQSRSEVEEDEQKVFLEEGMGGGGGGGQEYEEFEYFQGAEDGDYGEPYNGALEEEERDIKPLTILDQQQTSPSPTLDKTDEIKGKKTNSSSEHGQPKSVKKKKTLPKRRAASYPSPTPNDEGGMKKIKTENCSDEDDSDFVLESGLSSSNSDSDPEWDECEKGPRPKKKEFIKTGNNNTSTAIIGPPGFLPRRGRGRPMSYGQTIPNVPFRRPVPTLQTATKSMPPALLPFSHYMNKWKSNVQLRPRPGGVHVINIDTPPPKPISRPAILGLPPIINGVYFRIQSSAPDKMSGRVLTIVAKCGICLPVDITIRGLAESANELFLKHLEDSHPKLHEHYIKNQKQIDAATTMLREAVAFDKKSNGKNEKATTLSKLLIKLCGVKYMNGRMFEAL